HTPSGDTILPISRVGVGFVAGGSEIRMDQENANQSNDQHQASVSLPFGGGSGGGVSITPIAFLVVGAQGVKVVPLDSQTHLLDKVIDSAPTIIDKMTGAFNSPSANKASNSSDTQEMGMNESITNTQSNWQ